MRGLAVLVLLVSSACATPKVQYIPTNTPPRALTARRAESVQIFATGFPSRPYAEIGLIEASQRTAVAPLDEVMAALRDKAADVGCDAVVIVGERRDIVGTAMGNGRMTTGSVSTLHGYRGVCIVYTTPALSQR